MARFKRNGIYVFFELLLMKCIQFFLSRKTTGNFNIIISAWSIFAALTTMHQDFVFWPKLDSLRIQINLIRKVKKK